MNKFFTNIANLSQKDKIKHVKGILSVLVQHLAQ